jgi:Arc/MetJ-type ribon-helix-helix transcriptional regulator
VAHSHNRSVNGEVLVAVNEHINRDKKEHIPMGEEDVQASNINICSLPSISFQERQNLPSIPAIYFVVSSEEDLLYIGQTMNLQKRWEAHHRTKQLESFSHVRICWLSLPNTTSEELLKLEYACILHFEPLINATPLPEDLRRNRVQLDFSPDALERVEDMRVAGGWKNKAEVFRASLRLLEWFMDITKGSKNVRVFTDDGKEYTIPVDLLLENRKRRLWEIL